MKKLSVERAVENISEMFKVLELETKHISSTPLGDIKFFYP